MLSVICVTNRIGGVDLLFESLEAQTYRDFELILVDGLRHCRQGPDKSNWYRNMRLSKWASFPWRAIAPRVNPFPRAAYCRAVNTGIAHARGETIVLLCDYSWLNPDCLATHAACQAKNPGPLHLDYNYSALPELRPGLPHYGQKLPPNDPGYLAELNATTDRYCADLEAGKLHPFMWSIFAEAPTQGSVCALDVTHKHRPCATREAGDWNWCSFKNESFPTELFLEMNGLNEALDGSHCYQDQEFSYRLKSRGIEWQNGPPETGMATIVNPRDILCIKKLGKPIEHNMRLAQAPADKVNPTWSLREWRGETI